MIKIKNNKLFIFIFTHLFIANLFLHPMHKQAYYQSNILILQELPEISTLNTKEKEALSGLLILLTSKIKCEYYQMIKKSQKTIKPKQIKIRRSKRIRRRKKY